MTDTPTQKKKKKHLYTIIQNKKMELKGKLPKENSSGVKQNNKLKQNNKSNTEINTVQFVIIYKKDTYLVL